MFWRLQKQSLPVPADYNIIQVVSNMGLTDQLTLCERPLVTWSHEENLITYWLRDLKENEAWRFLELRERSCISFQHSMRTSITMGSIGFTRNPPTCHMPATSQSNLRLIPVTSTHQLYSRSCFKSFTSIQIHVHALQIPYCILPYQSSAKFRYKADLADLWLPVLIYRIKYQCTRLCKAVFWIFQVPSIAHTVWLVLNMG